MGYRIINGRAYPVGDIGGFQQTNISNSSNNIEKASNTTFKEVLQKSIEEKNSFTISKHAAERLKEINFNEVDMENIERKHLPRCSPDTPAPPSAIAIKLFYRDHYGR